MTTDKRLALVTGSSHGIGLEIASELTGSFDLVGINGRNLKTVDKIVKTNANFFSAVGDASVVSELERIKASVNEMSDGIDLLVCNLGGGKPNLNLSKDEEWNRVMNLNLHSAVRTIGVLGEIVKPAIGKIIFISSIASFPRLHAPIPYMTSKAALNSFSQSVALSMAPRGVCVNTLMLGNIMFPGSTWEEKLSNDSKSTMEYVERFVPLKKFGKAPEIAKWCHFLSSSDITFTTGAIICIDGGQSI
jgi:3-oxoacyl-[acyl-carrier protein] reductase